MPTKVEQWDRSIHAALGAKATDGTDLHGLS